MAKSNPFLEIRSKAGDSSKSLNWYQNQVKALSTLSPGALIKNSPNLTTSVLPGNMYMFFYDPKHKEKLPYWDGFPLVLPFRKVPGGFYGINLHYLPYALRFKLLGALHELAVDEKITESNKIRASWDMLLNLSNVAPVKACVKHYLEDHVQSRFLKIKYPDWLTASLLPVERFKGASKQDVWKLTREKF